MESIDNYALDYTRQILEVLKINSFIMESPFEWNTAYDRELRMKIQSNSDLEKDNFTRLFTQLSESAIITSIIDPYYCEFILLQLPSEKERKRTLLIGPFTYEKLTNNRIEEIVQNNHIPDVLMEYMQLYYAALPYVSDERWIRSVVILLAKQLWKTQDIKMNHHRIAPESDIEYFDSISDTSSVAVRSVEARYDSESNMMQYITAGNIDKLSDFFKTGGIPPLAQRFPDTIRDTKNKCVILNTLCRKAAQNGYVHPIYLDELSRKYAIQIEECTSSAQLNSLFNEIPRKYCMLVKSHSLKNYSKPIRDVMNKITLDLTDDLSLHALANELALNSSYLSNLFKKETGMTLTAYVNNKRIEHSIFLLNTTQRSIQNIAEMCGIPDVNYFTKLFKKIMNMTPTDYRNMIQGSQ